MRQNKATTKKLFYLSLLTVVWPALDELMYNKHLYTVVKTLVQ